MNKAEMEKRIDENTEWDWPLRDLKEVLKAAASIADDPYPYILFTDDAIWSANMHVLLRIPCSNPFGRMIFDKREIQDILRFLGPGKKKEENQRVTITRIPQGSGINPLVRFTCGHEEKIVSDHIAVFLPDYEKTYNSFREDAKTCTNGQGSLIPGWILEKIGKVFGKESVRLSFFENGGDNWIWLKGQIAYRNANLVCGIEKEN